MCHAHQLLNCTSILHIFNSSQILSLSQLREIFLENLCGLSSHFHIFPLSQGPEKALSRTQLEFALSSVNVGIKAAVAQLSVAIPTVKFLVLDWYSLTEDISEWCGI